MNTPNFRDSQVLQLIHGIAHEWGDQESILELTRVLRAVKDPQDYLRQVADTGRKGSANLVTAAILGYVIATNLQNLVGEKE